MLFQESLYRRCPYCGKAFEALVDTSEEEQSYYEDCPACCAPILFVVQCDAQGNLSYLELRTDRE